MNEEISDYLENVTRLLGGQIRGAINAKAREENLELIGITINDVFDKGKEYGKAETMEKLALENLKQQLKKDTDEEG